MNLAAPDSKPKLFTEETLAVTDRTGGDKTEVSSVRRALHSAFRTWAEALARWAVCLARRTLAGRSPPVRHDRDHGMSAGPKPVRRVVIQAETCLTVVFKTEVRQTIAIGAEALPACRRGATSPTVAAAETTATVPTEPRSRRVGTLPFRGPWRKRLVPNPGAGPVQFPGSVPSEISSSMGGALEDG